jgi:hypothetical protein
VARHLLTAVVALMVALGCAQQAANEPELSPKLDEEDTVVRVASESPERVACAARLAAALTAEALPGTPLLDGQRAQVLARAKGHPSVFFREPRAEDDRRAAGLRARIAQARVPAFELYDLYPTLARSRALARAVLLREGYLYADAPGLALGLATVVRLEHLFTAPRVFIQRGSEVLRAVRKKAGEGSAYFYETGLEEGNPAQILLFDRVGTSEEALEEPLHVDLEPLARELGFERAAIQHLSPRAIVAELRYDGVWVPTLLEVNGAHVRLECELPPLADAERVARVRAQRQRQERVLARQRAVILEQIAEGLPFDEPRTEYGQQDGKLRQEWLWAYRRGATRYEFNEDPYYVFDARGRPRVPQVCIDFIRDTYERAGGSWYQRRGEPRERLPGKIDFRQLGMDNERSVESFVTLAASQPEWFEVLHIPREERVPLAQRGAFYEFLLTRRDDFRPGDIVVILGLRDDGKMHYHSFFVFMADPITGMPTLVAANAGRPRVRTWEGEMQNAPLRSIHTRIRPKLEWLERVTHTEDGPPTTAWRPTSSEDASGDSI